MKRVAILTSGGDAPGMNNIIVSLVKGLTRDGLEAYLIYEGYKGLVENNFEKADDLQGLKTYLDKSGTFIYSARLPDFVKISVREKAVKNLIKNQIDTLVIIGGDGSFLGALKLHEMGIKVICIPATIDNDIASTDFTVGFYSALQVVTDAVEQIRATALSHNRVSVVEVMGRYNGYLALNAAISTGAEILSIPEKNLTVDQIIDQVKSKKQNNREIVILITEHQYDAHQLAKDIEYATGFETRATILGYVQRGGKPISQDRILASRMAIFAAKLILEDKTGFAVAIKHDQIVAIELNQAINLDKKKYTNLINIFEHIK